MKKSKLFKLFNINLNNLDYLNNLNFFSLNYLNSLNIKKRKMTLWHIFSDKLKNT